MPDGRDGIVVVGLAADFPGLPGVEEFWIRLMTGGRWHAPRAEAAPTLHGIVSAAVADAGHSWEVSCGEPRLVVFEAAGADPLDAVRSAARALGTGTCDVAVAAAADPHGACALVLRRLPDARADRDDVRAFVLPAPAHGPSDDVVRIRAPRLGTGRAATLATFVTGVLALVRESVPGAAAQPPTSWPHVPGRRRVAAAVHPCAPVAVEAPPARETAHPDGRLRVLLWAGDTDAEERAARFHLARFFVARGDAVFSDTAATLRCHERQRRGAAPVRAAAVCTDALDAAAVLGAVAHPRVRTGTGHDPAPPVALLFPGHAAPRTATATAHEGIRQTRGVPESTGGAADPWPIAVAAAVTESWIAAGIRPAALVTSGAGIVAAAVVADVLDPTTAARVLAARCAPDRAAAVASALSGVDVRPPTVTVFASADGLPWRPSVDPACWLLPELDPQATVDVALGTGAQVLVEVGADGTEAALLDGAAQLWTEGHDVDWELLGQPPLRRRVPLPNVHPPVPAAPATGSGAGHRVAGPRPSGNDWIELPAPEATGPTVLALPYAGGSGRAFRPLRGHLPADCGLALLDLPGHGRLMGQQCLTDVEEVLAGLVEAVAELPSRNLVLLGYSLGGSFAHELAARMHADGAPPAGVIVCGTRAPHVGVGHPPVAQAAAGMPFLTAAAALQLAAPEMLQFPELAETFAGPLHADLSMVESFPFRRRAPLPVPTCVVGFASDWLVPEPSLRAWDEVCADPPLHLRADGGHLAIHERPDAFGAAVATAVAHVLLPRAATR